jgi:hypothetical protein
MTKSAPGIHYNFGCTKTFDQTGLTEESGAQENEKERRGSTSLKVKYERKAQREIILVEASILKNSLLRGPPKGFGTREISAEPKNIPYGTREISRRTKSRNQGARAGEQSPDLPLTRHQRS